MRIASGFGGWRLRYDGPAGRNRNWQYTAQQALPRTIATLDTGASIFFDHRDPAMVSWLGGRRID